MWYNNNNYNYDKFNNKFNKFNNILLFLNSSSHVFISGHHVTSDTGTGIVHTAPAHGLDDFNICKYHHVITLPGSATNTTNNNDTNNVTMQEHSSSQIPIVSLPADIPKYELKEDVDEDGCYYKNVWTERLQGKDVLKEGTKEVVCRCRVIHA